MSAVMVRREKIPCLASDPGLLAKLAKPRCSRVTGKPHDVEVFDERFRDDLLQRAEGRPTWHRPEIWLVATAEERAEQRSWLNRTINALPEPGRSKIRARLPENAHFLSTYTELATAAVLHDAGMTLEYERNQEGKTPDITVFDGKNPSMLVEVYTKFRSTDRRSAERAWRALQSRIQAIPVPVILAVRRVDPSAPNSPDDPSAKRIAAELKQWLLQPSPSVINGRLIEGYHFMIAGSAPGLYANMSIPGGGGWFDSDMVLNAVGEKVKVYSALSEVLKVPLLVVLAAEPASPLSEDLVRSALRGDMSTTLSFDPFEDKSEPHTVAMRAGRVLAEFAPSLSAVGWMNPGIDDPGFLKVFPVPSAARPIRFSSVGALVVEAP
jgi:hypothetical protein